MLDQNNATFRKDLLLTFSFVDTNG